MKKNTVLALTFAMVSAVALVVACEGGGDNPPLYYCNASSDCPDGLVCEFPVDGGCSAQGECSASPPPACDPTPVCSCSGATENACVIADFTTMRVRGAGACAGADAGGGDAGGGDAGAGDGAQ